MAYRATKSGINADVHKKMMGKYDQDAAAKAMSWIQERTQMEMDTSGDPAQVFEVLSDGFVLLQLMKALQIPIGIKRELTRQKMPFKKMEYINEFLTACDKYGVPKTELFQTVDLYENQNIVAVITCIESLGRKVLKNGGPGYGIRESDSNIRNFSEEQMKAGQNVIGLQMGTNKGASQAGQSFGKARHIVD